MDRPTLAFFYDGNRMMGWNKDDGPYWHGTGTSAEERLYEAIEGMAELHERLRKAEELLGDPIRPLVWEEVWLARGDGGYDVTGWEAQDCYGDRYEIDADGFVLSHNRLMNDPASETLDEAKRAAQDDFAFRIRSGLSPALREALTPEAA